jgi:ABC-2 type transport system ATP-binding protein
MDAPALIVDAVPKGGEVRFIRQPEADEGRLDALVAGGAPARGRRTWKTR